MAWTTPPTFTPGTELAADDLNDISDDLAYLKAFVDGAVFSGVKLHRTSSQSIPDATDTNIVWQAEDFDIGSWWSSGSTITVPSSAIAAGGTDAIAVVIASIRYVTEDTGGRAIIVLQNGSEVDNEYTGAADDTFQNVHFAATIVIEAADTFVIQTRQNSGASLNMDTAKVNIYRVAQKS